MFHGHGGPSCRVFSRVHSFDQSYVSRCLALDAGVYFGRGTLYKSMLSALLHAKIVSRFALQLCLLSIRPSTCVKNFGRFVYAVVCDRLSHLCCL
jgi:hypothetical protein